MAKVEITIEDSDNGRVRVTSNPPMSDLLLRCANAHEITNAEAYAIFACNALRTKSRENSATESGIIVLPKVRGFTG